MGLPLDVFEGSTTTANDGEGRGARGEQRQRCRLWHGGPGTEATPVPPHVLEVDLVADELGAPLAVVDVDLGGCIDVRPSPVSCQARLLVGLARVLLGTARAGMSAGGSESWDSECYRANSCDSLTFTVVAELLDRDMNPYDGEVRREHVSQTRLSGGEAPFDLPFQYPPNSLPLFAARSWFSPRSSHLLFSALTTFVFLLVTLRLVRQSGVDPLSANLLVAGVAFSHIVRFNADLGQTGALAAALVVGATVMWRRSPVVAGILLGTLAFKPQYAIPLVLVALLRRDWRILTGAGASLFAFTVLSGIAFGFSQWARFLEVLNQPNHTVPLMVNWLGPAWRALPSAQLLEDAALPVFVAGMVVLVGVLWPRHGGRDELPEQLSVALAIAVVVSPNTHPYDLLVLVPALVYFSTKKAGILVGPSFGVLTAILLPGPIRWALGVSLIVLAAVCMYLVRQGVRDPTDPQPSVLSPTRPLRGACPH